MIVINKAIIEMMLGWNAQYLKLSLVTYRECIKDNIALHLPAYGQGFLPVYYSHEFYTT